MKKIYLKVEGMHCSHCYSKITSLLKSFKNIKNVSYTKNIFTITYENNIDKEAIISKINDIGYMTNENYFSENLSSLKNTKNLQEFIIVTLIIILILFSLNKILGVNIFNLIPSIDDSVTYGMLFILGLLTSIHCVSMCGGINLLASINTKQKGNLKRPVLYNVGRLISYTLLGGVVGLLGKVLNLNTKISSVIIIIASIIMMLMAFNMLGFIPFKIPFLSKKIKRPNNPFLIGFLNAFMPCGPLQSLELYALTTGSFIKGALSMFMFCLGTIPLMLTMGLVLNLVKGKTKIILNKIAISLMFVLAVIMLNRGLTGLGISLPKKDYTNFLAAKVNDEYQIVDFNLTYDNYADIIVKKDMPVKMIIHVDENYLTGCNNEIVISEFNVKNKLTIGDNIIYFTPDKEGSYTITCWMNMLKNTILVTSDETYFKGGS